MTMKPPPDRLYGRAVGHTLRARQAELIETLLPRLRWPEPFVPTPHETWLEIGAGGFEHAQAIAALHPEIGLIACEVFANSIASLLSRLAPLGESATIPGNLRVHDDDARPLIRTLPDAAIARVYLMFPDPWPKVRHAKRRFVHPATIADVARILKPGGEWRIASDDPTYQDWVDHVFAGQPWFEPAARATARPPGWQATRYEAKAIRAARLPVYWTFTRKIDQIPTTHHHKSVDIPHP